MIYFLLIMILIVLFRILDNQNVIAEQVVTTQHDIYKVSSKIDKLEKVDILV